MSDTSSTISNNLTGAIGRAGVSVLWCVSGRSGDRNSPDVAPFLESFLVVVVITNKGVGFTMPDLHTRSAASVARIGISDIVSPFLRSLVDLSIGAGGIGMSGVRCTSSKPAESRNTGSWGSSLKDVWIDSSHNVGHETSRRKPSDIYAVRVTVVALESVLDLLVDALGVAAVVSGERLSTMGVPAVVLLGGTREDHDKAILVGRGGEVGHLKHLLTIATASVELRVESIVSISCIIGQLHIATGIKVRSTHPNDNRRPGSKSIRDIDAHLDVGWISAPAADTLQRRRAHQLH